MAEGKRSFILYTDLLATVEKLNDNKAGKLFKMILDYVNDKNPNTDDILLQVAFEPIKQQLKRDLKDWEAERSKKVLAGKMGGIKSGESRRSRSKRSTASKNEANEAVTVTVNDTVTVTDSVKRDKYIFPDPEFEIELPELEIERAIEYVSRTQHVPCDKKIIATLWETFKIKKFTGAKSYKNKREIISHFFESLKFQKIENGTHRNSSSKSSKSSGAESLIESLRTDLAADGR